MSANRHEWFRWGCGLVLGTAVAVLAWRCPVAPPEPDASREARDASLAVPDRFFTSPMPPPARYAGDGRPWQPSTVEQSNVRDRIVEASRFCRGSHEVNGTTAIFFERSGAQRRVWTRISSEGADGHSAVLSSGQNPFLAEIRSCIERRLSDVTVHPFAGPPEFRIGRAW